MAFLSSLNADGLQHFHEVVAASTQVHSHVDLLSWLQGDLQLFLPHDVLVVSWGDFQQSAIKHDVLSRLPGVRTDEADTRSITTLMRQLHTRWTAFGRKPFSINTRSAGFLLDADRRESAVGDALKKMHGAIVHGVVDRRGSHDCLYVGFSAEVAYGAPHRSAVAVVLPYVDTAMRRVAPLPHQRQQHKGDAQDRPGGEKSMQTRAADSTAETSPLSERESEVLHWVARGKTNPEIGMILEISSFTVKNHIQKVFRKLDVSNRAQAVSKFRPQAIHA